jgi:hypothetical protein
VELRLRQSVDERHAAAEQRRLLQDQDRLAAQTQTNRRDLRDELQRVAFWWKRDSVRLL